MKRSRTLSVTARLSIWRPPTTRARLGRLLLRLLLDECIGQHSLADLLRTCGHDVVRVVDALEPGIDDGAVFDFAQKDERVILTYNAVDFRPMAEATPKDLDVQKIRRAIDNVAQTYPDGFKGLVLVLNDFNWSSTTL